MKCKLLTGRKVEDVLYSYASKLKYEQSALSFIIDTSDNDIKKLFTKEEWDEIMNTNKKTTPGINKNLAEHLLIKIKHLTVSLSESSSCGCWGCG